MVSLLSGYTICNRGSPLGTSAVLYVFECTLFLWPILSMHIQTVTSRARKVLGLLYLNFDNLSPPDVLLHLYLSLMRPHLVTCMEFIVEEGHSSNEKCVEICFRMATKLWIHSYDYVLYRSHINSLENRRTITRLCTSSWNGLCRM